MKSGPQLFILWQIQEGKCTVYNALTAAFDYTGECCQ